MIKPPYLKQGDTVAIVAPSGIVKDHSTIDKAIVLLDSWGLKAIVGKHIFDNGFHFASSDTNRLADLQTALDNTEVKAIWCARGGYGTVRIIDQLDFTAFKENPKWVIGYSDITVLHNHINNQGITSIHGMMPVNLSNPMEQIQPSVDSLKIALFGEELSYEFQGSQYNKLGTVSGQLVGGNLTLLENSLGTASAIDTTDKILFIEEIGEYKYHIDRMLWALKRNGYFENCKGVLIGDMSNIPQNDPNFGQEIEEIILNIVKGYNIPIAFNFPAGHGDVNQAICLGSKVELIINSETSTLNFKN